MGDLQGAFQLDLMELLYQLAQLAIAFGLALLIGWDREKSERSAGLRTFPLVAVSSCAYVMIGESVLSENPDAIARVIEGLMTGIGFIGGGAILKSEGSVRGTATAACIWNTGAIGAAVAFARFDFAIALTLMNVLILNIIPPFKKVVACTPALEE